MALKPPEEKAVVHRYVPIVDWLPRSSRSEWVRYDPLAAPTLWALLMPDDLAHAGIAGVWPEVGLDLKEPSHPVCDAPKPDSRGGRK